MRINYFNAIGSAVANGAKTGASGVVRGVKAAPAVPGAVGRGTVRGVKATPDAAKVVGSGAVRGVKATPGAVKVVGSATVTGVKQTGRGAKAVGTKVASVKNVRVTTVDHIAPAKKVVAKTRRTNG